MCYVYLSHCVYLSYHHYHFFDQLKSFAFGFIRQPTQSTKIYVTNTKLDQPAQSWQIPNKKILFPRFSIHTSNSTADFTQIFVYPSFGTQKQLFVFPCIPLLTEQSCSRLKYFRSTALKVFLLDWSSDYEIPPWDWRKLHHLKWKILQIASKVAFLREERQSGVIACGIAVFLY